MNQLMKRVLSVLLVVCLLCSALPSAFAAEGGGFTDVSKDHWAYDAITEAVAAGYFKGVSDTAFDPEGTLTRAMLVTVLARAAGAETDDNASTGFSDVAAGTWYTGAVAWAAENGVVTGDGDGTFAPNRPTSTGEMLKLVLLSTGHKEQKPSTAHWASGYATYAYSMGFAAQNYSDYQLDNGISRLDVARFAAKALGYGASNTTSPFADVNDGYVTALYEAGVFIAKSTDSRHFFVFGHPEYDTETLAEEYFRDVKKGIDPEVPKHYFPNDDPTQKPLSNWRAAAQLLYTNWLNYYVYQATPYDIDNTDLKAD